MPALTVAYAGTILLLRVSSDEQYFCQGKPEHTAFRASEGVKASRIQVNVLYLYRIFQKFTSSEHLGNTPIT